MSSLYEYATGGRDYRRPRLHENTIVETLDVRPTLNTTPHFRHVTEERLRELLNDEDMNDDL